MLSVSLLLTKWCRQEFLGMEHRYPLITKTPNKRNSERHHLVKKKDTLSIGDTFPHVVSVV